MNEAEKILRKHLGDHASVSLKGWKKIEPKKIEAILLAMEEYAKIKSDDKIKKRSKTDH